MRRCIGYGRGMGLELDWLVIGGDPEFFTVTKRLHNGLYGGPGDGGDLGERERAIYERTLAADLDAVLEEVEKGDIVVVHDPQPAGLIAPLVARGAHVVWRCHVGYDDGERVDAARLGLPATVRRAGEGACLLA